MNAIWIITDTLRRDHLGCYGNRFIHTPSLDALAAMSVRFDRYYVGSFPTMPSRADYLTGLWTGCIFPGWAPLPDDLVTLPQILSTQAGQYGGLTGGIHARHELDDTRRHSAAVVDTPFYLRQTFNYDRGFSTFQEIPGQPGQGFEWEARDVRRNWRFETDRFAPQTFTKAMQWLDHHYKEDFFLYIDTWDPHEPWDPPGFYTELYWPEDAGDMAMPRMRHWMEGILPDEADARKAHAFYCGEVTMVDTWLGYFIRRLENMNLMDKTAILFTSDHGTYHGEHGGRFGKHTRVKPSDAPVGYGFCPLYEEVAAAPLLIYLPGVSPGVYGGLCSAIDLAPTVLDILGHEVPSYMEGASLLPAMKDPTVAGREYVVTAAPFRSDGHPLRWVGDQMFYRTEDSSVTVTTQDWSLIYSVEPGFSELYHLASDPKQESNVIKEEPKTAELLHGMLVSFMDERNLAADRRDPRSELRL